VAQAIQLRETVPEAAANSLDNSSLRSAYYGLGVIEEYTGNARILPVWRPWERLRFGDNEGGLQMARAAVESTPDFYGANVAYIGVLAELGKDRELVDYFKSAYGGSLESYATRLRPGVNATPPPYLELAMALRSLGEQSLYEEAMQRMRFAIDIFRAGGDVSAVRDLDDARYWAIMGDAEKALSFLEQAYEKSAPLDIYEFTARTYDSLQQDPRYIALLEKNIERINAERSILGYAPLTPAFYDRYQSLR
jgi:tetratricopeptide (TPR) repeat protein